MLSLTFHKRRCVEPNADSDGAAVQAEVVTPQQPGLVATVTCTTLPRVSLAASPSPSVAFPPALTHTHNSTETPYPCTTYPQLKKKKKITTKQTSCKCGCVLCSQGLGFKIKICESLPLETLEIKMKEL